MTLAAGRPDAVRRARLFGPDLLRALAILMVLCSHAGIIFSLWLKRPFPWQAAVSGFFGVELFFVLSGYLIGAILLDLLDSRPTPRDWGVFLVRRWMRTLPAYWVWIALLALVSPPPGDTLRVVASYALMVQNLAWPLHPDWYSVSWSLAVEEWFYLLFPAALVVATWTVRAGPGAPSRSWRVVPPATILFLLLPVLLRWRLPESTNWDLVTSREVLLRLDAIAFGISAVWLERRLQPAIPVRLMLGLLGVAGVALAWSGRIDPLIGWGPHVRHTLLFDAVSLSFALCLPVAAALPDPPRWLRQPTRALSERSYGIYLVHLSLLQIIGGRMEARHWPVWPTIAGTTLLIFLLPSLSWRFLERPILLRRPPQEARRTALPVRSS